MRILTIGAKLLLNRALGERFEVVAMGPSGANECEGEAESELPFRSIAYRFGSKLNFTSIRQVREVIKATQPEVIHAFYPRPLAHAVLAATSLGSRIPIVSYRGITSQPSRWSPDEWLTYLSPRVAAHACESAAVAESLAAVGVPSERCHVVHNCLHRQPAATTRQQAREKLGLSADAFVVMMVANMRPVKGADLLLEAAIACRDLPRLRVVLVGRVLDRRVEQLARDSRLAHVVQLAGYRSDASDLFAAADLFVMSSRAEALCVALLEAMSQGVCPVVSDAGGMKEAVRDGVDGVVFPRENAEALAEVLRTLHASPEQRIRYGESAQQRIANDFSAAAVANRLATMYATLRQAA